MTGTLRLQDEYQNPGDPVDEAESRLVNYSLQYHPLETAALTLSVSDAWGFLLGELVQENTAVISQFHGSLLPGLNMSSEAGFNRSNQIAADRIFDTWSCLVSFDGDVTPRLGALVAYSYRNTKDRNSGLRILQNRTSGNLTMRLTQTILLSAEADVIEDGTYYVSQAYNAGWRVFPRLNTGVQAGLTTRSDGTGSQRYACFADYDVAGNGHLYFQYNHNRSTELNGESNTSAQVGVQKSF